MALGISSKMKILTGIFLFISLVGLAQVNPEPVFSFKPAVGINACQIHGDSYSGFNKAGIFAGIAVNSRLNSKTSLELGFYFSQKGARHNQNPDKNDYTFYLVNLNYIDMPLSFHHFLNKDFYITLGPSIAYLVNYSEYTDRGNWTGAYPFEKFEYGVNASLGRKIKDRFFVEVRTSNSVAAIRPYGQIANLVFYPNPVARFFNKGLYNNILTFMVSYKLTNKKKNSEQ